MDRRQLYPRRGEYFGDVPRELDSEYAMYLDYDDILNLCHTQTSFRNVCSNDEFWREKTEYELSKYEDNYDRTKYEGVDQDGDLKYDYIPLPEDEFLRNAIEHEQYHYIKYLFEMFDFSDDQLTYAIKNLKIKDKRIFDFLWDKFQDRTYFPSYWIMKHAYKYQDINKIKEFIESYEGNFNSFLFSHMLDLPEKDFALLLQLISDKGGEFSVMTSSLSQLFLDPVKMKNVEIYFNHSPQALGKYITRQIKDYNKYEDRSYYNRKTMRGRIIDRLEFLLDTFLVSEWKGKIQLPSDVVDKLFKLFKLPGESKKILESWRE